MTYGFFIGQVIQPGSFVLQISGEIYRMNKVMASFKFIVVMVVRNNAVGKYQRPR